MAPPIVESTVLVLLSLAALAAPTGHYYPAEIAAQSALYARAAEQAGGTFEARSAEASTRAAALLEYELGLDLLGDRAPAAERVAHAALEQQYNRELATVEAFANVLMEDFDTEFTAAMARALEAHPGEEQECAGQVPVGRAIPGIPQRTQDNPDCVGEPLSATLAAAMDADPALATALEEILAIEWPVFSEVSEASAPIGAGDWASVTAVVRLKAADELVRIDREDELARTEFAAAVEEGATQEQLEAMVADAHALDARTASLRADVGGPVLDLAEARLGRHGAAPAWCARPPALGGCTGADRTRETVEILKADRKFLR